MRIVAIDECSFRMICQPVVELSFPLFHTFKSPKSFEVRLSNICDQTVMRLCNSAIQFNFFPVICSHFNDCKFNIGSDRKQCKWNTNVIIQISFGCESSVLFGKYRQNQFLRCCFPIRTGNSKYWNRQLMTVVIGQTLQRLQSILHKQTTITCFIFRFIYNCIGCSCR